MSGEQQLSGPDLGAGIAETDLADGAMLLGHAQGEPVLLARQGDAVFAIAAHCTHYGGPLADGLLVGTTVRCPWHHACFDLRSGEAVRAPALNPVACYDIERAGGRIRVSGKRAPRPVAAAAAAGASTAEASAPGVSTPDSSTGGASAAGASRAGAPAAGAAPESVVILGAGAAGNAAAERLRRRGYGGRVTLVGAEADGPYDRPNLSKDYLAGNAPEEWIPLHPKDFYDEQRIELRLGSRATGIDAAARQVRFADGSTLSYGALLLATGAEKA